MERLRRQPVVGNLVEEWTQRCKLLAGIALVLIAGVNGCSAIEQWNLQKRLRDITFDRVELYWIIDGSEESRLEKVFESDDSEFCRNIRKALLGAVGPKGSWYMSVALLPAGVLKLLDVASGTDTEVGVTQLGFFLDNSSTLALAFDSCMLLGIVQEMLQMSGKKKSLYLPPGLFPPLK